MKLIPGSWGDPCYKDTHVNNTFINNYMADAPGDFIKVYLYFLMQAELRKEPEMEEAVTALKIDRKRIEEALLYWGKLGVLEDGAGPEKKDAESGHCPLNDQELADTFSMIQRIVGRPLGGSEPAEIVSWLSDYGATPEMIIYAFTYSSKNRHNNSIKYISAIVKDWAEKGLTDAESIEKYLESCDVSNQKHRRVFRALGFLRNPTEAERELMDTWFEEKGITVEKVLEACSKTTGISNPNLNYIDKILSDWQKTRGPESKGPGTQEYGSGSVEARYARLRDAAKESMEERKKEVYRKMPALKDLDEKITNISMNMTRTALQGGHENVKNRETLKGKLDRALEERAVLLTESGFPPDYTDIRYRCGICRDTGMTAEGLRCACYEDTKKEVGANKL